MLTQSTNKLVKAWANHPYSWRQSPKVLLTFPRCLLRVSHHRNLLISNFRVVPTRKLDLSKTCTNSPRKIPRKAPKNKARYDSIYKGENLIESILGGNQIKTGQTVSMWYMHLVGIGSYPCLWRRSYFCCTAGNAGAEAIQNDINDSHHWWTTKVAW